ncbi:MAG TPA: hypothetical protein VJA47_00310 [archaeon]|nr:hypothetical protein [archaeon]
MKNLLTLAVLAVVVIISGCTQGINQTPTQSTTTLAQPSTVIEKFVGGDDFKVIGYPGTWKTKLTKEAILFIGPQESGVVVMFSVIRPSRKQASVLEDFALNMTGSDVAIISKSPRKVNGMEAYEVVSTFTDVDRSQKIKAKDVFVNTPVGVYELLFTSPEASYEKYVQMFEDSIAIFELSSTDSKTTTTTPEATELSSTPPKSECSGFSYFAIKNHKLTESTLMLDIQNGANDITVVGVDLGGNELTTSLIPISANEKAVVIATGSIPLTIGSEYRSRLTITYNLGSSSDKHEDVGTCTGVVQ